ncbi:MAG: hypothetical protein OER96_13575 [Gammaproteobacteria bacterium]|nr:hypothetical protein [Gammaproteobacteria bacterium]
MNMHKLSAKYRLSLLLTSMVLPALSCAQSESQTNNVEDSTITTKTAPATAGGRKAYIDPNTGELTTQPPVDQTIEQGQRVFQQSSEGLVEEIRPDGSATVNLHGRFRMPLRLRKNCDGSVTTWHGEQDPPGEQQSREEADCPE